MQDRNRTRRARAMVARLTAVETAFASRRFWLAALCLNGAFWAAALYRG